MKNRKLIPGAFFLGFILIILPAVTILADVGDWQTFTNKSSIRGLIEFNQKAWCATNGGVAVFSSDGSEALSMTNTEGLSSNDVSHVAVDHNGNIWFGFSNGIIDIYNPANQSIKVIDDFVRNQIKSIVPMGDSVFIGLNIGVSLFLLDKMEVKETYKNLGQFPVETGVKAIAVDYPYIWVGTPNGVARADLRQSNLMAPQSWENFTANQGLPSQGITALFAKDSTILAGTNFGTARFDHGNWVYASLGLGNSGVHQFFRKKGKIYAVIDAGVYEYDPPVSWKLIIGGFGRATSMAVDSSGIFWIGTQTRGVVRYNPKTDSMKTILPNGPGGNNFMALVVDQNNNLWTGSAYSYGWGFGKFDGQTWTNFTRKNTGIPSNDVDASAVDLSNHVWLGTWGRGVYLVTGDSPVKYFNASNGYLVGIRTDTRYAVVTDIKVEKTGTVWMLNYFAYNQNVLVAMTPDSQWVYFSTSELGLKSTKVTCLLIDHRGWKWIGTEDRGISVFTDNGTPLDKSDDQIKGDLTTVDGLESNSIAAIAEDDFGTIWIGTKEGLDFYLDGKVQPRYGLITNDINCITIDPRNNKWIGTSSGLSMLDPDGYRWTHYTTDNSPIAGNNVHGVAFNPRTGELFVGTTEGLSRFQTPYIAPRNDLSQLRVYPNPYLIGSGTNRLVVDGLARASSVTIFTAAGRLVKSFPEDQVLGARISWDGRDEKGEWVASGIYIVVAATADGKSNAAKFAIVRK
ncbi:two component regulator propeller [bacterium BMS3Abin05]|nr:two component regulator propeller [bacterium BMS3Abin05]GBE27752.1 two component regulator propeller [bacterium BMS3Bbin03]